MDKFLMENFIFCAVSEVLLPQCYAKMFFKKFQVFSN